VTKSTTGHTSWLCHRSAAENAVPQGVKLTPCSADRITSVQRQPSHLVIAGALDSRQPWLASWGAPVSGVECSEIDGAEPPARGDHKADCVGMNKAQFKLSTVRVLSAVPSIGPPAPEEAPRARLGVYGLSGIHMFGACSTCFLPVTEIGGVCSKRLRSPCRALILLHVPMALERGEQYYGRTKQTDPRAHLPFTTIPTGDPAPRMLPFSDHGYPAGNVSPAPFSVCILYRWTSSPTAQVV